MSTIKVITLVQRRRRWAAEEKRALVEEGLYDEKCGKEGKITAKGKRERRTFLT